MRTCSFCSEDDFYLKLWLCNRYTKCNNRIVLLFVILVKVIVFSIVSAHSNYEKITVLLL